MGIKMLCDTSKALMRTQQMRIAIPRALGVVMRTTRDVWYERSVERVPKSNRKKARHLYQCIEGSVNLATNTVIMRTSGCHYAAAVHEGVHPPKWRSMGAEIDYTTPETDWKYIEVPMYDTIVDTVYPLIYSEMRKAII
jgi:hypothetical protein